MTIHKNKILKKGNWNLLLVHHIQVLIASTNTSYLWSHCIKDNKIGKWIKIKNKKKNTVIFFWIRVMRLYTKLFKLPCNGYFLQLLFSAVFCGYEKFAEIKLKNILKSFTNFNEYCIYLLYSQMWSVCCSVLRIR